MTVEKEICGSKAIFRLTGRLDTKTAPDTEKEITSSLDGITELVLDMGGVNYISSIGLRVLLTLQKRMNKAGSMKLIHVCGEVMEILQVTAIDTVLTIE